MNTNALIQLWNVTQEHSGTSGARAAAGVLLALYNGTRFPCDLTDLRLLDGQNLSAAIAVITDDARRCQMEVHEWLNRITGRNDFGARFEHLAHEYTIFKRGRCKVNELRPLQPARLRITPNPDSTREKAHYDESAVRCQNCGCEGPTGSYEDCQRLWNTRPREKALEAMGAAKAVIALNTEKYKAK